MPTPMPLHAGRCLCNNFLFTYLGTHLFEVCIENEAPVFQEYRSEVGSGIPFAGADPTIAKLVVEREVRIIPLPGRIKSLVDVSKNSCGILANAALKPRVSLGP